jgi:hypothetical protein
VIGRYFNRMLGSFVLFKERGNRCRALAVLLDNQDMPEDLSGFF